jgi:hypothetical protein
MPDTNSRDLAESIDVQVGEFHLDVLANGEEVISPTGELIRKRPSAAMIGKMQQYVQMHGVAEKASGLAANIQESLRKMRDRPSLKLTGTDGKNALAPEAE